MADLAAHSPFSSGAGAWSSPAAPRPAAQPRHLSDARDELVARIERSLVAAATSDGRSLLLLRGPRGIGKTRVLEVLTPRARARVGAAALLASIPERLHPTSLVQFLARCLQALPDDPELGPSSAALLELQRRRDGEPEAHARALIHARLRGRPLLIMLEHLDELLDTLGAKGRAAFAQLLLEEPTWTVLATARTPIALESVEFEVHTVAELEVEPSRELLVACARAQGRPKLADSLDSAAGLARVRALHHLLGGNPRALHLLAGALDAPEGTLQRLARDLAPHFRERCARLSPSQRLLAELLSESWRPLTVSELAERSFSKPGSVSGALRHLRREGLVQALEVGRERYYELADPLDRLARSHPGQLDFARVLRRFHAANVDANAPVAAPDSASPELDPAALDEARSLLSRSHHIAAGLLRARLASRKSPIISAALALALERNGAHAEALRVLLAVPQPRAHEAHAALLSLAWEPAPCVELVAAVVGAQARPEDPAARATLLDALARPPGPEHRALCQLLASYDVIPRWLAVDAHVDLGRLLQRWRPPRSTPRLEAQLIRAIELSLHSGRLALLLPPGASFDALLAIASPRLRQLLAHASVVTLARSRPAPDADELDAELRRRLDSNTGGSWPEAGVELEPSLAVLLLDGLTNPALRRAWSPSPELARAVVSVGLYGWVASRRPLAPIAELVDALGLAAEQLPHALLDAGTPREALARLAADERELVRAHLRRCGDDDAIDHFPTLSR